MKKIILGIVITLFVAMRIFNSLEEQTVQAENLQVNSNFASVQQQNFVMPTQQYNQYQAVNGITVEQAKEIAVASIGLKVTDVVFVKTLQDYDDGIYKWEIEFVNGNYKYEYDVSAVNGAVLKSEVKPVAMQGGYVPQAGVQGGYVPQASMQGGYVQQSGNVQGAGQSQIITLENAKSIALNAAGLALNNVTFTKTKMDYDDGIQKWEIEFIANAYEYEYEINAMTGVIVKSEIDSIYD